MVRVGLFGSYNWLQLAATRLYLNRFPLSPELNLIGQEKPKLRFWPGVKKKRKPNIYGVLSRVIISDGQAILNLIESQPRPKILPPFISATQIKRWPSSPKTMKSPSLQVSPWRFW
jgi:hypothetical protein